DLMRILDQPPQEASDAVSDLPVVCAAAGIRPGSFVKSNHCQAVAERVHRHIMVVQLKMELLDHPAGRRGCAIVEWNNDRSAHRFKARISEPSLWPQADRRVDA